MTPSDIKLLMKNWKPSIKKKNKGIILRARARWHGHGEKSTKYFLNLEKRNHVKKRIRKRFISGVIKTDPFCILKEQERFYRDLKKSKNNDEEITQQNLRVLKKS